MAMSYHPGSSPLARGLLLRVFSVLALIGIIPARAGFTGRALVPTVGAADHPRSRGVYGVEDLKAHLERRIIPARAGFTSTRRT